MSEGERTLRGDVPLPRGQDGGRDDPIVLVTEVPAVARVGIQRRHGDAWPREPGQAKRTVRQADARQHGVEGDQGGDRGQRHVRGDAGVPEAVKHIELPGLVGTAAQNLRHVTDLVHVGPVGHVHRRLVERREADPAQAARRREPKAGVEIAQGEAAACCRRLSNGDDVGIEVAEIQDDRAVPGGRLTGHRRSEAIEVHAQGAGLAPEDASVSHDDQVGGRANLRVGQQLDGELGPDARRITDGEPEARTPGWSDGR